MVSSDNALELRKVNAWYGDRKILNDLELNVPRGQILGIIGPAGGGKTTLMTCLNRTLELIGGRSDGQIQLEGDLITAIDPNELRRRVAMVLPLPVGLPMSIYDNVAFAPRLMGITDRRELDETVERCLTQAALWDEVKDRLGQLGTRLSGGQQQRLTLARALSTDPEILCLDEFSIAIDPVTTMRIEAVLVELKKQLTVIMVTNLLQQARRIADRTVFVLDGRVIEEGPTDALFDDPSDERTRDYVNGKFG